MVESVSEHFANLQHVIRGKTCVSVLNALFLGIKVAKLAFYSIGTKCCFGVLQSISLTTTRIPLIYDEILMTFFDFVIDHISSMTNSQISS
jgi:hypothetical protein